MQMNSIIAVVLLLMSASCVLAQSDTPSTPLNITKWQNGKALFIGAHPDDIEAAAGGTIALLTAQNTAVYYLIITNGDKGCANTICKNWTTTQIAYARSQEAVIAANSLSVPTSNVFLLTYEDTMVTSYPEQQIREDVIYYIRKVQPNVVMSWFPYPNFNMLPSEGWSDLGFHPDHQAVGRIVLSAQFVARVPLAFTSAGPSFSVPEYYIWDFLKPVFYVDVSSTIDAKVNAFLQHKTQYQDPAYMTAQLKMLGDRVANNTLTSVQYAEGFIPFF